MSTDVIVCTHSHKLQITEIGRTTCMVFEFENQPPITTLLVGDVHAVETPLVRLHSRCLYAEVFRSEDCDCLAQRDLALLMIKKEGAGAFLYLEQEGRGSGTINKAKAYAVSQSEALDTVKAFLALGLDVDPRSYSGAAAALARLGMTRVRLLTNNPAKVSGLADGGIIVERVPLRTRPTDFNLDYLKAKQSKLGHDLGI